MVVEYSVALTKSIQKRADSLAQLTGHSVEEMLSVLLMLSAPIYTVGIDFNQPVGHLSDGKVQELAAIQILPDIDQRQSELLKKQQNDALSDDEAIELKTLNHIYEIGLIYKSQALAEAVKRGLRSPLEP